jgi:thiamine-phosphate pyrophosphorylase
MRLPRLYAIIDRTSTTAMSLKELLLALQAGGATLIQYRNKQGAAQEMLSAVRELKRLAASNVKIIMNDRADLSVAAGLDGVHLGQDDLSVGGGRALLPSPRIVGISTHNLAQLEAADATSVDYIAYGPIFATGSKMNPDPVVGLKGLREARQRTKKPVVAIGGITLENCKQAIDAGADSVAVISALAKEPQRAAEEFLRRMT